MNVDSGLVDRGGMLFRRRYGLPIAFGIMFLVSLGGFRLWVDSRLEEPIVEPYQFYLDQLAAASPAAQSTLRAYFAQSGRDSVASQDFLPLCATMTRQASEQGVNVQAISRNIAQGCVKLGVS
jgi:hypothetical protein